MAVVMIKIEDVEGLVEVSYTVDGAVPDSSNKYSAALELASYLLAYADSILNPDDLAVDGNETPNQEEENKEITN